MALRKNKDLGAMELAGLLQEGGEFTPVDVMSAGDVTSKMRSAVPSGSTFGIHWTDPRIAINTAFPGNFGGTFGHELAHEGFSRYGFGGKSRGSKQHDLIGPYLAQNYRRSGSPVVMREGEEPVLRHQQVGPDVSRGGRVANPSMYWKGSVPASSQELGLPFTVSDVVGDLERSQQGQARRKWWNANKAVLMRRMASATGGSGR